MGHHSNPHGAPRNAGPAAPDYAALHPGYGPNHSALAPDALTTLPHFSVSAATNAPNWPGVIGIRVLPHFGEARPDARVGEPGVDLAVEAFDDLARRAARRHDAGPAARLEPGQGFRQGRYAGQHAGLGFRRHRQHPHGTRLDLRQRGREVVEHRLGLAADQVGDGGGRAPVRHVHHAGAGHGLEQFAREMARRAGPNDAMLSLPGRAFA